MWVGAPDGVSNPRGNKEVNRKTVGGLKTANASGHQEGDNKVSNAATTGTSFNLNVMSEWKCVFL